MKKIYILGILFLLSGCTQSKQDVLIGTFETTYELGPFEKVKESYIFKKKGECIRILNAGNEIVNNCTYEIKKDKIRILWNNKFDKESYSKYIEIDDKTIIIDTYKFIKTK